MSKKLSPDTLVIHAGFESEETTGALMPPIFLTSTYLQSAPGEHKGYDYGRSHNQTRYILEDAIAALEGGKKGLAFASGLAAVSAVLDSIPANSHIICIDDIYGGTFRLFEKVKKISSGLKVSYSTCETEAELEKLLQPDTKLVWIETPTNPLLKIVDLELIANFAKKHNLLCVADNTFASCYLQKPLDFGFDVVIHSSTKYINGHSDIIGGLAVIGDNEELADRLAFIQNAVGAVPSPFDCYMTYRGMKTLALRMQRHCDNAEKIVEYLMSEKKVKKIYYPGLESHPNHAVAGKQMKRFGGMISFEIDADLKQSKLFLQQFKLAKLAESLGGLKTLIEHPALMTHATIPAEQRSVLGISDGLIRLSAGAEDADDLLDELKQAFKTI